MKYGLTFPNYGEYCDPRFMAELAHQSEEAAQPGGRIRSISIAAMAAMHAKASIKGHPVFIEFRNFDRLIAYT